jgi:hypothetical protein
MLCRGNFEVVCCTQNFLGLLQRVFNLASREKSSCSSVLVLVFIVFVNETEFMVIGNSSAEGADRSGKSIVTHGNVRKDTYS